MEGLFFYLFSTVAILSALLTITRKDAVTSVFWLIFCFLCIAALFALLSAHFMAILQILLYAGAIMVFFLFVTMFLGRARGQTAGVTGWPLMLVALATLVVAGAVMTRLVRRAPGRFPEVAASYGSVERTSELLLTRHVLGFEVTGLLLTAAVIGAVFLARREAAGSRGTRSAELGKGPAAPGPTSTAAGNGGGEPEHAEELVKGASDHA